MKFFKKAPVLIFIAFVLFTLALYFFNIGFELRDMLACNLLFLSFEITLYVLFFFFTD